MNKRFTTFSIAFLFVAVLLTTSCTGGDPHKKGIAAGEAACECYKIENIDEVENCITKIEKEYEEYMTDTAFINAVETKIIECISQEAKEEI